MVHGGLVLVVGLASVSCLVNVILYVLLAQEFCLPNSSVTESAVSVFYSMKKLGAIFISCRIFECTCHNASTSCYRLFYLFL